MKFGLVTIKHSIDLNLWSILIKRGVLLRVSGEILDELDMRILKEIVENPNSRVREIARKIKVPKSTIYYRVQRLKRMGVIKGSTVLLDSEKLGFEYNVVILVKAKYGPRYHEEVGKMLADNKYIQAVYYVLGDYDFVVFGKFPKKSTYMDFLERMINSGLIERSVTIVVARVLKEDFKLGL